MSSDTTLVACRTKAVNRMKKLISKKNGFLKKGDIVSSITTAVQKFNDSLEAEIKAGSDD